MLLASHRCRKLGCNVILGVLQARMTSTRLPGKVLATVLDEPMIGRQIERLRRATSLDGLVVVTSTDPSDDPLVAYLGDLDVEVVRGSLDDVLSRFVMAIDLFQPDVVVRLTADCPLASPAVLDLVVSRFAAASHDYVSNTLRPTYPDGLDVEVVRADVLRWVAANTVDPHEREHVTLGVYRRPERFDVANVEGPQDLSGLRWTVDDPDDLEFVRAVYGRLYPGNPAFDVAEILDLLRTEPSMSRTTMDAERNAALKGLDTGAMNA
jgi:spore coat polysaccharide biosynthesis protein SpsF